MPSKKMYSPASPVLSSISGSGGSGEHNHNLSLNHQHHHNHYHNNNQLIGGSPISGTSAATPSDSCLKFKYFTTFLISTTCLGLLSTSLATHKWIISRPIRILKLNGGQTNVTSLMLTAQNLDYIDQQRFRAHSSAWSTGDSPRPPPMTSNNQQLSSLYDNEPIPTQFLPRSSSSNSIANQFKSAGVGNSIAPSSSGGQHNNKFQGEIYFGLFSGVKVLNYGFGDRISQITVYPISSSQAKDSRGQSQEPLVDFKLWLATLFGTILAAIFALIGAIFAIINFVMTPKGTFNGPVGLVIWNSVACFSCLLAIVCWLVEYFVKLKANVLTPEEVQNGWTSENKSQFGYSYYLVVTAFVLHLVNILIVSVLQFETWTNSKAAKRQMRASAACEGVIMLY